MTGGGLPGRSKAFAVKHLMSKLPTISFTSSRSVAAAAAVAAGQAERAGDRLLASDDNFDPTLPSNTFDGDNDSDSDFDIANETGHGIKLGKMPKSNTFDYTNRRNSGAALGTIISDHFGKQLETYVKASERQANRARKASGASIASSVDNVSGNVHPVLLIVPGKDLTDDGVAAMVLGMEEALRSSGRTASLAVEEIDLRNNGLTTASLAKLAPVIEQSTLHLQSIVLSGNAIKVATDEEARHFETFLKAFHNCMVLRRLDLSGNTELGARAFEVLARVHSLEPAITPASVYGEKSVVPASEEALDEGVAPDDRTFYHDNQAFGHGAAAGFLKRRCGLRSLPYLEVHGVGLDDAGALWLSFVLEDHYLPSQLINEHNAVSATVQSATYSQNAIAEGINWTGNDLTLGKEGLKLLKQAELVRRQMQVDDAASLLSDVSETSGAKIVARRPSRHGASTSKASLLTLRSESVFEEEQSELVTELRSMRMKLHRQVIEHDGVKGGELSGIAVAAVITSRKLAFIAPITRKLLGDSTALTTDTSTEATPQPKDRRLDSVTGATEPDTEHVPHSTMTGTPTPSLSRSKGRSYAATLAEINTAEPGITSRAVTEVTNSPITPKKTFKAHRKGGFSEGSDLDLVADKLSGIGLGTKRDNRPERFIEWQQKHRGDFEYRDTSSTCHLPLAMFAKIVDFVTGSEDAMGILSEKQKRDAYAWGQHKTTLGTETGWLRHLESAQKLMLLEAVGCLSYGGGGGE